MSEVSPTNDLQMQYMNLLVAQLKNQNPLEPMDNNQMTAQLAQFSQLEQLASVNNKLETANFTFSDVMSIANRNYANSLIGREVTFFAEDEQSGDVVLKTGVVDSVYYDISKDENLLGVSSGEDEYTLGLNAVVNIEG